MTPAQAQALVTLQAAVLQADKAGLFDVIVNETGVNPDVVNGFCDAIGSLPDPRPTLPEYELQRQIRLVEELTENHITVPASVKKELADWLARYEKTGDHNHGSGRIKPGAPCEGGDCLVAKARTLLGGAS